MFSIHHCFKPGSQLRKNQLKNSTPPHIFPRKTFLSLNLGDNRITPPRPEVYPQNLTTQYLVVWGSKNQQSRGFDYSNLKKEEIFFGLIKTKRYLG